MLTARTALAAILTAALIGVLTVVLAGCETTGNGTTGTTGTPGGPGGPAATAPPGSSPADAAPPQSWTMPNLVGKHLQAAQDAIQELTGNKIFLTSSHDATGQDRQQVLDDNWQVCSQNVAPGTRIVRETTIDFGAVKLDETCP